MPFVITLYKFLVPFHEAMITQQLQILENSHLSWEIAAKPIRPESGKPTNTSFNFARSFYTGDIIKIVEAASTRVSP